MEFKTLVYVIVGLVWLLSKLLQNQRSPMKLPLPNPDQRPDDFPVPGPVPRPTTRQATRPALIKPVTKKSGSFNRPSHALPEAYSYEIAGSAQFDAGMIDDPAENNSVAGTAEPTVAARIAEEVSNGTIDLKKTFLINELLNRKYT